MALSRGARFILVFVMLAVAVSMGALVATYVLATRGPAVQAGSVLWLQIPAALVERVPDDLVGQLTAGRHETIASVVSTLRRAKRDDRIESLVIVPPMQPGLWGKVQELRDAVLDFRESGKQVTAYMEYGGSQQYYLATAADDVVLTPTSPLDLVGVASYEMFLRDALDKFGIHPDMLHAGEFKTASNLYTETTFTPEHREMTESLNGDLYDQLVEGIAEGRGLSVSDVRTAIDAGPFLPGDAVERGLVDDLLYEDELLEQLAPDEPLSRRLRYGDYRRAGEGGFRLGRGPKIAVVYGVGVINFGGSGFDGAGGGVMGSDTMARAIREARNDDTVEAVILRIDSPGGAAIAADIIWHEVELAAKEKPVIASMSDVAASGGYYIAAPADVIVAQPGTLTGSIGVVGGKLALGGALDKLGVNVEAVTSGEVAGMNSPFSPYSAETRRRVQTQIDAVYETFLERVAAGRGMSRDEVHAIAQGRVWTGRQAADIGLVDELGGLRHAVALAKEQAGIATEREVQLVTYPRPRSLLEVLNSGLGVRTELRPWIRSPADRLRLEALAASYPLPAVGFRPGEPLALMSPLVLIP